MHARVLNYFKPRVGAHEDLFCNLATFLSSSAKISDFLVWRQILYQFMTKQEQEKLVDLFDTFLKSGTITVTRY